MAIWVLTSEYNLYDQQGEYFVHAWDHCPSLEELKKAVLDDKGYWPGEWQGDDVSQARYEKFVKHGGGRDDADHFWHNLQEFTG